MIAVGDTFARPPATSSCPAYGNRPLNAEENRSRILATRDLEIWKLSAIYLAIGPAAIIDIVLLVVAMYKTYQSRNGQLAASG